MPSPGIDRQSDARERRSRHRALALYIAAIVGPTLVLISLGILAVERQRAAVEDLSAANRRLEERTLATALEERMGSDAELCLRVLESTVIDLETAGVDWERLPAVHRVRMFLDDVARAHPLAHAVFLIEGGRIRLPRVEVPLPRTIDAELTDEIDAAVVPLLVQAQRVEFENDPAAALNLYRRAFSHPGQSRKARALALSRMARCYGKTGNVPGQVAAYRALIEQYADEYDLAGRPHALVAWRELQRTTSGSQTASGVQTVVALAESVAAGRWELDPDSAQYYGDVFATASRSHLRVSYLDYLALGRLLKERLSISPDAPAGAPRSVAVGDGRDQQQLYYLKSSRSARSALVVGFAADVSYVRSRLLERVASELPVSTGVPRLADSGSGGTSFRNVLPGLEVVISERRDAGSARRGDILIFGGAVGVVLAILLLGVVLLLRDVSREAATSRMRAELVGGVSHELKTPLTAIRMYAETLAADPEASREERRLFSEVIVQESDRLTRLIDRVLDFSRVERQERSYMLRPTAVVPLVERVVAQYRSYLAQQGFTCEVETDSRRGSPEAPTIRADPEALAQALVNLIDNAIKYSRDERWIAIRVRRRDGEVHVEVEDRGEGISADERWRVFDRFYRSPSHRGRGGYGLGLYLVKHIIDAHAGRIEVATAVGRGSRFTLVFPLYHPENRVGGSPCQPS